MADTDVAADIAADELNLTTGAAVTLPNLEFVETATVNANTALNLNGLTWPCGTFAGASSVTLNGPAILNDIACGDKVINGPTLLNSGGQMATWTGGNIVIDGGGRLDNAGMFDIQTDASITDGGNSVNTILNQSTGTFIKTAGAGTNSVGVILFNLGLVEVQSGAINFTANYRMDAGVTRLNGGDLLANVQFQLRGGTLEGDGNLTGDVLLTADVPGATVAPGFSAGVINQTGTFTRSSTGTFNIELGGTTPGNMVGNHDQYNVTGTANLDGTLTVTLIDAFTPIVGDTFTILTASVARNGQFTTLNLPDVSPNSFQVNYLANAVELEVVANAAPNAVDDNVVTLEDTTLSQITPLDNDSDTDGPNPLSISAVSDPPNGTAVIDMGNLTVSYTPDLDFNGMDSFTYDVTDGANTVTAT
ncbi:MAG: cadherin-like domain-containing protein, partial [Armatimonadetes bacterium]|nr:cadherin-like domain-containing protein [Armatimonadota bacterium]